MRQFQCPVCGYAGLEDPPYKPSGAGSYEFCDCCGFQFGVTDHDKGVSQQTWRERWIEQGMQWDQLGATQAPERWDPRAQLKALFADGDTSEDNVRRDV